MLRLGARGGLIPWGGAGSGKMTMLATKTTLVLVGTRPGHVSFHSADIAHNGLALVPCATGDVVDRHGTIWGPLHHQANKTSAGEDRLVGEVFLASNAFDLTKTIEVPLDTTITGLEGVVKKVDHGRRGATVLNAARNAKELDIVALEDTPTRGHLVSESDFDNLKTLLDRNNVEGTEAVQDLRKNLISGLAREFAANLNINGLFEDHPKDN
ncbi:hypothetical protein OS493_016899 [Desmophyllum pertusum]|uniref:Uncharacterized protein n=1 Tax=Desmophyllum pertusum TaxID=174260 RepID=A0A9W9YNU9_9CNID|nr:hypothetical protein OS493_016899 [Desmophyllum pertusum]